MGREEEEEGEGSSGFVEDPYGGKVWRVELGVEDDEVPKSEENIVTFETGGAWGLWDAACSECEEGVYSICRVE